MYSYICVLSENVWSLEALWRNRNVCAFSFMTLYRPRPLLHHFSFNFHTINRCEILLFNLVSLGICEGELIFVGFKFLVVRTWQEVQSLVIHGTLITFPRSRRDIQGPPSVGFLAVFHLSGILHSVAVAVGSVPVWTHSLSQHLFRLGGTTFTTSWSCRSISWMFLHFLFTKLAKLATKRPAYFVEYSVQISAESLVTCDIFSRFLFGLNDVLISERGHYYFLINHCQFSIYFYPDISLSNKQPLQFM
jgi:hypothetical protein